MEIPIDFYSLPEEENINNYQNRNKNNIGIFGNNLNKISELDNYTTISGSKSNCIDSNVLGDYPQIQIQKKDNKNNLNKITYMDFEIIDENDFYDI